MRTDDLILALAQGLPPAPRHLIPSRIALGLAAGVAASLALFSALLGPRPDLMLALGTAPFWSKVTYSVLTAAAALWWVARLARPDTSATGIWLVALPALLYLPVGIWELVQTDPSRWAESLLGHGWRDCTWQMLGLAVPLFAGLLWAFRAFAPTDPESAGAAAGMGACGVGSLIFSLHCGSNTAVFVLAWYTLAFIIAGGVGAMLGRRLLRW